MEIPRYTSAHRTSYAPPEIFVQSSNSGERRGMAAHMGFSSMPFSAPSTSIPMAIPNTRDDDDPPPPLPPPRIIPTEHDSVAGVDAGWQWSNSREEGNSWGRPANIKPGSSLYGSSSESFEATRGPEYRRGSSASTIKSASGLDAGPASYSRADEGYASLSTAHSMKSFRSTDSRRLSNTPSFQGSAHEKFPHDFHRDSRKYDNDMIAKLNSCGGSSPLSLRQPRKSPFSTSFSNGSVPSHSTQRYTKPGQKPLSMPTFPSRLSPFETSPDRWLGTSKESRVGYSEAGLNYRSPTGRDAAVSPRPQSPQTVADYDDGASSISHSCRDGMSIENDMDFPLEESARLQRLHIDEHTRRGERTSPTSAAGQKRKTLSSPREDGPPVLHTSTSISDLYRRRESVASAVRASPIGNHYHSNHGSVSSTASGTRNASLSSVPSLAAASVSTVDSYNRLSPGGFSPGGLSPGAVSPRTTDSGESMFSSSKLNNSPRDGPLRTLQRPMSDQRPLVPARIPMDTLSQPKGGLLKVQSGFVCECCPKKPKKFDTEDALIAHESEKQYECAFCKNRFKNKNEAERHQNSLHLRRHSWSCSALNGPADAFHPSPIRPSEADTCGYCGQEFSRSGPSFGHEGRSATEKDWEERLVHLKEAHKFRDCNHTKKFFRADHFRQHLKHSHAGVSGKWTNILEVACMKEEMLDQSLAEGERIIRLSIGGRGERVARINEEDE